MTPGIGKASGRFDDEFCVEGPCFPACWTSVAPAPAHAGLARRGRGRKPHWSANRAALGWRNPQVGLVQTTRWAFVGVDRYLGQHPDATGAPDTPQRGDHARRPQPFDSFLARHPQHTASRGSGCERHGRLASARPLCAASPARRSFLTRLAERTSLERCAVRRSRHGSRRIRQAQICAPRNDSLTGHPSTFRCDNRTTSGRAPRLPVYRLEDQSGRPRPARTAVPDTDSDASAIGADRCDRNGQEALLARSHGGSNPMETPSISPD
jgi:hypothetical protein